MERDMDSTVMDCLLSICENGEKDSDRIAAAKLILEHNKPKESGVLTVVMEGEAEEYAK